MTCIFAERSAEKRREGEALIREADNLACQSWNERMWSDGGPIDPSPTIYQAINGGFPWLEIKCSRCQTPSRCRSMCTAPRADDMRTRSRPAIGLSEVQEGWEAPGSDDAPASTTPAPAAAGRPNAKLKSDFRCYPNNGHAATASAGPFCAMNRRGGDMPHKRKTARRCLFSTELRI
jgi:hypothetical protein